MSGSRNEALITAMSSDVRDRWLAVQVWTGREQMSSSSLRLRGYDVFLPTHRVRRRWSDRIKSMERALFPGYTFCRVGNHVAASIVTARGVIGIVGDGVRPIPVPDHEIESIRRIVDSHLVVEPCAIPPVGRRIRVEAGPLAGAIGVVERVKGGHRLVACVQLLHRAVAVEIDVTCVSCVEDDLLEEIKARGATAPPALHAVE